jgi:hypothetical protein
MWTKEQQRAFAKKHYEENIEKYRVLSRAGHLRRKFGISIGEYEALMEKQGGCCAICELPETMVDGRRGKVKTLAVDHCHDTGKIRGLLCSNCNRAIGLLKDSTKLVSKALSYLEY